MHYHQFAQRLESLNCNLNCSLLQTMVLLLTSNRFAKFEHTVSYLYSDLRMLVVSFCWPQNYAPSDDFVDDLLALNINLNALKWLYCLAAEIVVWLWIF